MVKNVSVRQLRAHLADVVDDVTTKLDRYVISKRGRPAAVLMCVDDYEGWLETLEIMSDKKAMADIRQAKKELARGEYYSLGEIMGKIGKKAKK